MVDEQVNLFGIEFEILPFNGRVTAHVWELMKRGSKPQSMEDRWCIVYDEGYLKFIRSWKPLLIFMLQPIERQGEVNFDNLYHRVNCKGYNGNRDYALDKIETLVEYRKLHTANEPWFGWDALYPRDETFLKPDLSRILPRIH